MNYKFLAGIIMIFGLLAPQFFFIYNPKNELKWLWSLSALLFDIAVFSIALKIEKRQ